MKKLTLAATLSILAAVAVVTSGCGDTATSSKAAAPRPTAEQLHVCPRSWKPGWQRLANKIDAPVYCPTWLPAPLTGQIVGEVSFGGAGGPSVSVDKDRSYLVSLAWAEPQSGEVHVNLRGYPGRTKVPTCLYQDFNKGKLYSKPVPCFADARGTVHERGITATVYTVNQDADLWHVLYAWHYRGGLYTLSEHVAEPLTYAKVVANLHRMLRGLVVVRPKPAT
jgi:hypothetical protein